MKLNFIVSEIFLEGAKRLEDVLGYEISDSGIKVFAVEGDRTGVALKNGEATIYYKSKVQFFRGIGVLIENVKKSAEFELFFDTYFDTVSTMLDTSRCAVASIKGVKKMLDYLAVMGYNMMMLYTEDLIKLESRKYFGYMRGSYTVDDLREIDDYAYEYGIEVLPCIECYGHMEKYLMWPEAAPIKDTEKVLLAREEKTFEFLEELIATASSAFRSNRIHIGMDEAWDMGRGAFLTKHGYVAPIDIFTEFMERLTKITDKYGLRPMLWSDMYFRASNKDNRYYGEDIEITDEVKAQIPENIDLVFWHYGEEPFCDDYMLKKHNELGRPIMFAGGNWGWSGHFPENNYMMITNRFSLDACRKNGVKEAMFTIWGNDNAECSNFANLFGLSFFAELCYNENISDAELKSRFEACTGGDYDLFYKMCYYHNDFEKVLDYEKFGDRFFGKPIFWQDILAGLYDSHLFEKPMSKHYKYAAEVFANKENKDRWGYLYELAYMAFDYLAVKAAIAERLHPAYNRGDKATLKLIAEELLPELIEKTNAVHSSHKKVWFTDNKVIGWQNLDVRYGGVAARCETAIMLINQYLDGVIDAIEELEEPRLYKPLSPFRHYSQMATVNLKT